MSKETLNWLNQNVLVGMTDKRGNAWHYKASEQGAEANHYPGAIPVEDVRRRLFAWQAEIHPLYAEVAGQTIAVNDRRALVRNDNNDVLSVISTKYQPHQYDEWLLTQVGNILSDDLVIGSAGLLRGGRVAWIQVEMPESMRVADVEFRPHLLATTSFDMSIPTMYKRTVTVVVCDNTRYIAMRENGEEFRVRHTINSMNKLAEARDALNIVHQMGDDFAAEVEHLLNWKVSDAEFDRFLNSLLPLAQDATKMAQTNVNNTRDTLRSMWTDDDRVAPWRGTAYGAVQAVNTYRQHLRPTRGGTIAVERTMMDALTGYTGKQDAKAVAILSRV